MITDNMTHPQAAAPGYAMYYLWAIRHLPQEPYLEPKDDSPSHTWMLEKDAKIWPNR